MGHTRLWAIVLAKAVAVIAEVVMRPEIVDARVWEVVLLPLRFPRACILVVRAVAEMRGLVWSMCSVVLL